MSIILTKWINIKKLVQYKPDLFFYAGLSFIFIGLLLAWQAPRLLNPYPIIYGSMGIVMVGYFVFSDSLDMKEGEL